MITRTKSLVAALALVAGCKAKSALDDHSEGAATVTTDQLALEERTVGAAAVASVDAPAATAPPVMPAPGTAHGAFKTRRGAVDLAQKAGVLGNGELDRDDNAKDKGDGDGAGGSFGTMGAQHAAETATRAWFPETFLFEPLVVTDAHGDATVPVRVPDRLTTWHVLALGHARNGAQAGAETSFLGTLPTYVDPIVPKRLVIGDRVRVPIQLVNTTAAPVTAALTIAATHATVTGGAGTHTIAAHGSTVVYATLIADQAGTAELEVALAGTDAIKKTIEVTPAGMPIVTTRSGTLAAPRTLAIDGPAGSDPTTDRVRLLAYPGALALLRAELLTSPGRAGGLDDDAYALLLTGRAPELLGKLGAAPDGEAKDALRTASILISQRALRDARTLDVAAASLIAEAALAHPENPVVLRLGERAADTLGTAQRPDGTYGGGQGWTLQRVLVTTAEAVRAVRATVDGRTDASLPDRQRALAVSAKASGAFARNLARVEDGYTAAALLASHALDDADKDAIEALRATVRAAIKTADDGSAYLAVASGVVRPDGVAPSRLEATALAVLALQGDAKAPLANLGATLIGGYALDRGWGDGRTNLAAMRAVIELFKDPVPANVQITLTMDGKPITAGTLSPDKIKDVLALELPVPGIAGAHTWAVTAEPAVPGLGFSLALESWVPWPKEAANNGLELALPAAMAGTVGKPIDVAITAVAPSGHELHLQETLPAGMQVDRPTLDALVSASVLERYEVNDGLLDLYIPALAPGHTFAAKLRVVPTLAGTLHASASTIELTDTPSQFHVPPTTWTIRQ